MLDLQRTHIRFFEMAKQRLVDDLEEREYQGLTIATPEDRFPQMKEGLRKIFQDLAETLAFSERSDTVIRIQCAAYKITRR